MEAWYQTKEGCSLQHAGAIIPHGKKIFLPEELAALHNSTTEQLIKSEEPTSLEETGVKAEWDYLQEQKASKTSQKSKVPQGHNIKSQE